MAVASNSGRLQVLKPLRGPTTRRSDKCSCRYPQAASGQGRLKHPSRCAYGLTSLPPQQVDAERLLALEPWPTGSSRTGTTAPGTLTFGEDASLMHTGHGPSNNAIVNHTALAIIFHRGFRQVQAAVQHFAMDRAEAIRAVAEPG